MLGYDIVLIYLLACIVLVAAMIVIPFILVKTKNNNPSKFDIYECGSEQLHKTGKKISFKFYIIAILFVIFDIEICLLLPWALFQQSLGIVGFIAMIIVFFIITLGFIYEYRKGIIKW